MTFESILSYFPLILLITLGDHGVLTSFRSHFADDW